MQVWLLANNQYLDDPTLIADYKRHHENVWPEITQSIRDFGIVDMEIYLLGPRMVMIREVDENFSFEANRRGSAKPQGAALRGSHVDVSATLAVGRTRREMDADGEDFHLES